MRCLPFLVAGILLFSGCLDFLDENNENRAPQAVANSEGGSNFEPNEEITFTGKGSNDPDGDILEYFWDFDKNDEKMIDPKFIQYHSRKVPGASEHQKT